MSLKKVYGGGGKWVVKAVSDIQKRKALKWLRVKGLEGTSNMFSSKGFKDCVFGGVGDEEMVVGEGVVVISSSLEMLTNSCLGGIMVSLIFLEGFDEEAFVEFMVRILQKSQENGQNRANTDTGKEREYKSRENASKEVDNQINCGFPNSKHCPNIKREGYTQEEGIDYDEVFAPVARIEAIRLFLAYASFKDFVVYQMDVKSAFLYGKIEEEVYVCQPPGFEDPEFPDKVYKVEKALYGLHQAPRAWYETLSTYLLDNGFQRGQIDKTLFIKRVKGDILLVQMSSMGELTFFLGLQVTQKDDGIFISQDKYVDEILKKFGFSTMKTASTPMETSKPLLKDAEAEDVDVHLYRSMIGSLMYLTASRPDIMFVVCACARFQVTPKVSHLHAVKRIFRYLKGQPKLGLWYPKDSPFNLEAYTDSDYAGASLDRKSTT
ncbi:putative ribonuclease H-like domain-containing protein [Tanacetum coccineum]